jgi:hypothetical protein
MEPATFFAVLVVLVCGLGALFVASELIDIWHRVLDR